MPTYVQAIVRTGGKQYRIEPGALLRVEKLAGEVGAKIQLSDVLLVGTGAAAVIGTPVVPGAVVTGTITAQGRGPKLIVYKFKRRKNQRKRNGHRQQYTAVKINEVVHSS